jgi:CRISPR type I-E-associated protein CasB/Cse2
LRRCIGLLRDRTIAIDYARLTWDLAAWEHDGKDVQRRWARDFYRSSTDDLDPSNTTKG